MDKFIDYSSTSSSSSSDLGNYYNKSQIGTLLSNSISENNERFEIEAAFKSAFTTYYKEPVKVNKQITQINIWTNSGKSQKLFTKNFTYSGKLVTTIELIDETNGNRLVKGFSWLNGEWASTSANFIGA